MSCYVFLDTNVFLHYRWVSQVKWHNLVGVPQDTEVVLVVAQSVMKELDEKQVSHPVPEIRERARRAIENIGKVRKSGGGVRDGVTLMLMTKDPDDDDFRAHDLHSDLRDDQLLASVFKVKRDEKLVGIPALVAHDFALSIKAEAKGISVYELPASDKLKDARTKDEKIIEKLREENERLKGGLPIVKVAHENGKLHMAFTITDLAEEKGDYCQRVVQWAMQQWPKMRSSSSEPLYFSLYPQSDVRDYNERLDVFYEDYRSYAGEQWRLDRMEARTLRLNLKLSNTGNSPAKGVCIDLVFPDYMLPMENSRYVTSKEKPQPPKKPGLIYPPTNPAIFRNLHIKPTLLQGLEEPRLEFQGQVVTISVPSLKHLRPVAAPPIYVFVGLGEDSSGFSIAYAVHADNLPTVKEGKMHVTFSYEDNHT